MISYSTQARPELVRVRPAITVEALRHIGLLLIALGVGTSSFTFNWIISHDVSANFFPEFAGSVLYLSDLFIVSGLITWLIYRKSTGRLPRFSTGPLLVFVPLTVLTLVSVLSLLWAEESTVALTTAARRTYLLAVYIVLVTERRTAGVYLAAAIVMSAVLHGVIAIAQAFNESAIGVSGLGELTFGAFGYGRIGSPDGYGVGFNPNPVAVHIAVGTLITYALLIGRNSHQALRVVLPVLLVAALLGTAYTGAKSAFITMALGLLIVTAAGWWSQTMSVRKSVSLLADTLLLVVILGGAVLLLTPSLEQRVGQFTPGLTLEGRTESYNVSVSSRFDDYSLATPIIGDYPILGVGSGNYPRELRSRVAPEDHSPIVVPVHSVPLLVQAELGIIGSVAWLVLFASPVLILLTMRGRKQLTARSLIWLGPLVVVMAETLADFTPWATQDGRLLFIAVLAMWAGQYHSGRTVDLRSWRTSAARVFGKGLGWKDRQRSTETPGAVEDA